MVDTARLSGQRLAEFERDREESNRRYDHAFAVVLSHTSAVELDEFWSPFSTTSVSSEVHSNPMGKGWSKCVVGGEDAGIGDIFDSPAAPMFGFSNPLALAGETNKPMVQHQVL